MSLAATLTYEGEFDRALSLVDRSIDLLDGDDRLMALSHRAGILQRAGRHREALEAFDARIRIAGSSTDPSIEADLSANRGVLYGLLGEMVAAEIDTQRALDVYLGVGLGQARRRPAAQPGVDGRATRRHRRGACGDSTSPRRPTRQAGVPPLAIFPDRCETLLAAGLAREALALAERSAASLGCRRRSRRSRRGTAAGGARPRSWPARPDSGVDSRRGGDLAVRPTAVEQGWSSAAECLAIEARMLTGHIGRADLELALDDLGRGSDLRACTRSASTARLLAGGHRCGPRRLVGE